MTTKLPYTLIADGTDGQIITWSAAGVATVVGPGNAGEALLSSGAGAEPVFGPVAQLNAIQKFLLPQRIDRTNLASASNLTPIDLDLNNDFTLPMTENTTLQDPLLIDASIRGQSGVIEFVQDNVSPYTLAFGAQWKFDGGIVPVLSTNLTNRRSLLFYKVHTTSAIAAKLVGPFF